MFELKTIYEFLDSPKNEGNFNNDKTILRANKKNYNYDYTIYKNKASIGCLILDKALEYKSSGALSNFSQI